MKLGLLSASPLTYFKALHHLQAGARSPLLGWESEGCPSCCEPPAPQQTLLLRDVLLLLGLFVSQETQKANSPNRKWSFMPCPRHMVCWWQHHMRAAPLWVKIEALCSLSDPSWQGQSLSSFQTDNRPNARRGEGDGARGAPSTPGFGVSPFARCLELPERCYQAACLVLSSTYQTCRLFFLGGGGRMTQQCDESSVFAKEKEQEPRRVSKSG